MFLINHYKPSHLAFHRFIYVFSAYRKIRLDYLIDICDWIEQYVGTHGIDFKVILQFIKDDKHINTPESNCVNIEEIFHIIVAIYDVKTVT